jgi:hypothetical protein
VPATQVRHAQLVSVPGQSVGATQSTQAPLPSHILAPPHDVRAALLAIPHALTMQVRVEHSVSDPGQLAAVTHATQCPLPSQTVPPPPAQGVATGALDPLHAFEWQVSPCVHALPSSQLAPSPLHEVQVTSNDCVAGQFGPGSPSETVSVTSGVPGAVQVKVAWAVEAPLSVPPVVVHVYESGEGTPSRSLATAPSVMVPPTDAWSGVMRTLSMLGQTLSVPPMITLPLFFCFTQRKATGTLVVVFATTSKVADPKQLVLLSVEIAVSVMV